MVQDLVLPMGMVLQLPAPGMQHSEEAGPVATDVLGVLAKLFHGVRRSREERRVANPLVRADEVAQLRRDGVGHHEVMARHHPPHFPLQGSPCGSDTVGSGDFRRSDRPDGGVRTPRIGKRRFSSPRFGRERWRRSPSCARRAWHKAPGKRHGLSCFLPGRDRAFTKSLSQSPTF